MKQSTRLSSAVFQLTPTRTRCDLIIIANDKKEKIASGLLDPFLAHLKTAQDQIAKGGYSILLEPETGTDASWFTKATLERFIRFVSTPEILERVYTIKTEILQIEEAIALQSINDVGQSTVDNHQQKSLGGYEGDRSVLNANDEKAIVLYTPGSWQPESNGSCSQEEDSKVQLLKVLETRKMALQKEQGMAFARAVAAGYDIDNVAPLVSFAECFGAVRLMEACSRFMDLWKRKHETGKWLDIEASEALYAQPDSSSMKAYGIVLSGTSNKQDESNHGEASEHNGKPGSTQNADNPVLNGQREYYQAQIPHLVFPPWPMHAPPGVQPVFQAYPVQGMPHYQTYTGNGPFVQPHQYPMAHSPSSFGPHSGQNSHTLDVRDSNNGSEMRQINRTSSLDDTTSDEEVSSSRKQRKKVGGSNKRKSGMVVIRNINYITSKEKKSGIEENSESHSDVDTENEYLEGDNKEGIHRNGSSKNGGKLKSVDTDDRNWLAFQDCLLRGNDEDAQADNVGIFAMEKGVKIKRRTNTASDDPLAVSAQDRTDIQGNSMKDIQGMSRSTSHRPRGSGEEVLFSNADNDFRGSTDQTDIQSAEANGRKILFRTTNEDFMVGSQHSLVGFRNPSDPLVLNSFEGASSKKDRDSSTGAGDETLIRPFRSISLDQDIGETDRTAIDIDSEIPSKYQKTGSKGSKNNVNYEPNDLTLMPERSDRESIGYDPALDYKMQVCAEVSDKRGGKDVANVKSRLKKPEKDKRSKGTMDTSNKLRTGGPIRKGKSSKMSPLEDARARAERLRSYKADLQKMKKEKEEAEAKRIEALKLERQKRIAARGGTTSVKPSTLSLRPKQLPAKLSPVTNRGSKFSDSEPGSSSPLQRSKVRTSLGSVESNKASKVSKLSEGSHMAGNRLTRSPSSLSEKKRESNGFTPEPKASMSRIRRLSEPKAITSSPAIATKARSAEAILKRKKSEGPDRNKVSAIINLDKSKAATLPELKIKTPKSNVITSENIKGGQKVTGVRPSMLPGNAEQNTKNFSGTHRIDADENPIVEKTVVLECEKPSFPTLHLSEGKPEAWNQLHTDHVKGERSTAIRAPLSPMDGVGRDTVTRQLQKQSDYNEANGAYSERDPPNFLSVSTSDQPYTAPYARVSSLEDPCTRQSDYGKATSASSGILSVSEETVKEHVPNVKALGMGKKVVASDKASVKEPSKGFRRLLKFGKKNHASSSSVDRSVDSECNRGDRSEQNNNARNSTGEVHTLKNLILQDETSSDGHNPQKTLRHFSLLSPFRSKRS